MKMETDWTGAPFAHAKHQSTATMIIDALKSKNQDKLRDMFRRGLGLAPKDTLIVPREDAPLKHACLDIDLSIEVKNSSIWITNNLRRVIGDYEKTGKKNEIKTVIALLKDGIAYFSGRGDVFGCIPYPASDDDELNRLFTSLITCFDGRASLNSNIFEHQFGSFSPFFIKGRYLMNQYLKDKKEEIAAVRDEWERHFGKVYRSGDLDEELFIKHAYLSLLVKNVLFCKYLPDSVVQSADSLVKLSEYFDERGVEMFFNDFYAWANYITELREEIFQSLRGARYETDDIFRVIYQDMVSPSTRHALGEFYTPPELARLMIDDAYQPGQVVLDPACGSGMFLVEIISKIKQSGLDRQAKIDAIRKIYGFDVNPIAVLVSKANILIHLEDLGLKEIPVNIFLTDSLFPIRTKEAPQNEKAARKRIGKTEVAAGQAESEKANLQEDMLWGDADVFILGDEKKVAGRSGEKITATLGELTINNMFLCEAHIGEFKDMLRFIDKMMVQNNDDDKITKQFDEKYKMGWLDQQIPASSMSYRANVHAMIRRLNKSSKPPRQNQNHIGLYLLYNSLGPQILKKSVDLLIGNPPWLILSGINSKDYKERVKNEAQTHNILMGGKNAANTELTSLFCYCGKDHYLKEGGTIFFVVTAGIMSGEQHSKLRRFKGFGNVTFWVFDKDVFKIHNVCLKLENISQDFLERIKPHVVPIICTETDDGYTFEFQEIQTYIPNNIQEITDDSCLVERLNPEGTIPGLLPRGQSAYKAKFFNGARLAPRNLLFINTIGENGEMVQFTPNMNLQLKKPWQFKPYEQMEVEKEYVFNIVKSTEVVPFNALRTFPVFLPVEKADYDYDQDSIKRKAKEHFMFLDDLYKKHLKKGGSITDLWSRINYNNGLANGKQKALLKVVYPGIGGMIVSALVRGEIIIDDSLYYYPTGNENEAYYLMGIFNSRSISRDLTLRGSTGASGSLRNIHKKPLDYKIPNFNETNVLHGQIVKKSQELEKKVEVVIQEWRNAEYVELQEKENRQAKMKGVSPHEMQVSDVKIKPMTLQNLVMKQLDRDFQALDELVVKLITS